MALSDYTVALLTAVQNGTAYIVPDFTDKNGVVGSGKLHFPGEENYTLPKTRYNAANINASKGIAVNRTSSKGRGNNVTFDPNSSFVLPPLYGGTEGTLADIYVNIGSDNKVLPSGNINNLINIRSSGGPTGFSQLAATLFPVVANFALPGIGTAFSAINSIAQGADVGDVLKSVAINQGLSALGNAVMTPEVDLNAATSGLQDVYGGNLPIEDIAAAFEPVVPEGVTVGAAIPTPDIVPTPLPAIESSVVQPDYFSVDAGPLADTTQDIESIIPPENPFLAGMEETTAIEGAGVAGAENPTGTYIGGANYLSGMEETTAAEGAGVAGAENPTGTYTGGANYLSGMEETTATEGAGVAGADNPTGTTVTVPGTVQEATKNLTPQQAYQLLKLGAGLFGGAGALTAAAKGLTGGAGALGGLMGSSMPSIQAPTPFTGTYSGMNPYDAAYFQQVQQNYNRLFPTTPANVAGPLESWYQTKYVPDTTISNKLFGV